MSNLRYSQPSTSQGGASTGIARSSVPAISTSSHQGAAGPAPRGGTYPISPSPRSALPTSQSYAARHRFSSTSGGVNAPPAFLARTSVSGIPGGAGSAVGGYVSGAGASGASSSAQDLLDRPRDKTKNTLVAASSLVFLFAELVSYTQGRVSGIGELEKKLSLLGYHHGQRLLPLLHSRLESPSGGGSASSSKNPKRETRLLPALLWVHGQAWKALFGKQADSLERSTERSDEYMISTNSPLYSRGISVPKDMSQLSVEAYTAGIVEAILDGMGFPARVTAHSVPTPDFPQKTTILIKLDKTVMEREEALGT